MNIAVISGRLGRDPELRYTTNNKAFVFFSVAVRRTADATDWFDVQAWDKLAENISKNVTKGTEVTILGRLETSKDKNNQTKVKIVANEVHWAKEDKPEKPEKPKPQPFIPDDDTNEDLPF